MAEAAFPGENGRIAFTRYHNATSTSTPSTPAAWRSSGSPMTGSAGARPSRQTATGSRSGPRTGSTRATCSGTIATSVIESTAGCRRSRLVARRAKARRLDPELRSRVRLRHRHLRRQHRRKRAHEPHEQHLRRVQPRLVTGRHADRVRQRPPERVGCLRRQSRRDRTRQRHHRRLRCSDRAGLVTGREPDRLSQRGLDPDGQSGRHRTDRRGTGLRPGVVAGWDHDRAYTRSVHPPGAGQWRAEHRGHGRVFRADLGSRARLAAAPLAAAAARCERLGIPASEGSPADAPRPRDGLCTMQRRLGQPAAWPTACISVLQPALSVRDRPHCRKPGRERAPRAGHRIRAARSDRW